MNTMNENLEDRAAVMLEDELRETANYGDALVETLLPILLPALLELLVGCLSRRDASHVASRMKTAGRFRRFIIRRKLERHVPPEHLESATTAAVSMLDNMGTGDAEEFANAVKEDVVDSVDWSMT
jgi:hypothetical protein